MLKATRILIILLCAVLLFEAVVCFAIGTTWGIAFGIVGTLISILGIAFAII